jgi:hypothetical protein
VREKRMQRLIARGVGQSVENHALWCNPIRPAAPGEGVEGG